MFCPITLLSIRFPLFWMPYYGSWCVTSILEGPTLGLLSYMCHIVKILEDCMNITEDFQSSDTLKCAQTEIRIAGYF